MNKPYAFDTHFQFNLLTLMVRKPSFIEQFSEALKPEFFGKIIHSDLCSLITKLKKDFSALPTYPVLLQACKEFLETQIQGKPDLTRYEKEIEQLYSSDLTGEEDYTSQLITKFARQRAMELAVLESAELVRAGRIEEVEGLMKEALRTGEGLEDLGVDFFSRLKDFETDPTLLEQERVATLNRMLDAIIGGGLGIGELGVILAPTGVGKSIMLLNLAVAAIILGLFVVYYSLELSEKAIQRRLAARLSGMKTKELSKDVEGLLKKLGITGQIFGGRIFIKRYPARKCSVRTIESHLERLKAIGFIPDIVFVDYGDKMRAERHYTDPYHEQGTVYSDLADLSIEQELPIWTASQTTRKSLSKVTITMEDVADSFEKCRVADIILALCQTKEEYKEDKMRIFVAKNREGRKGMSIEFEADLERSLMREEKLMKEKGDEKNGD